MHTGNIIDLALGLALLVFAIVGAKRGLFMSLARLLIVVVALVGAGMVATWFQQPATDLLTPIVQEKLAQKLEAATEAASAEPAGESLLPAELTRLLEGLASPGTGAGQLAAQVEQQVRQTGAAVAQAAAQALIGSLAYLLLFVLSFVLLLLLLRVLAKAVDLAFRLPGLHGLNTVGGFAFGLIEGSLWLFLAVWIFKWIRPELLLQYQPDTILLRFFAGQTPIQLWASLRAAIN